MKSLLLFCFLVTQLYAETVSLRYTYKDGIKFNSQSILEKLRQDSGLDLSWNDFKLLEEKTLSNYQYLLYFQAVSGVPVKGASLRIWAPVSGKDKTLKQLEVTLDKDVFTKKQSLAARYTKALFKESALSSEKLDQFIMKKVVSLVRNHPDDKRAQSRRYQDYWVGGDLVREVTVKARRGEHTVLYSLLKNKILNSTYKEFPQADQEYLSIPAKVYPIYEEVEATREILGRVPKELKYLHNKRLFSERDPFESLRSKRYLESMYDNVLAETEEGQAKGYWSSSWLKKEAKKIQEKLPLIENEFGTKSGFILEGKYTTINIHPKAIEEFKGVKFPLKPSAQFKPEWIYAEDKGEWEVIPMASILGKPSKKAEDIFNRPAQRHPEHDPVVYINEGFDEVQVYYAVTEFMEVLGQMGFTDPELSSRPFHSFLFDPDIGMRDNAYYTDDTINFTTYSANALNYARDNSTIWHELGHGIMDRLMGDYIRLADTGGLSEGMADLLAQLIVEYVSEGKPFPGSDNFRINNNIGFNLTNEVHDDGEAYGGSMQDMIQMSIEKYGREGLLKMADLTLDAMRLTRNHPGLTAADWFNHMLYADEFKSEFRQAGELREIIIAALNGRNFSFDGSNLASMNVLYDDKLLNDSDEGSRENPIRLNLSASEEKSFELSVSLKGTDLYAFQYPVTVELQFEGGPLQGAVNWIDESSGSKRLILNSEADLVKAMVGANGNCDTINTEDESCKDFVYIKVFNANNAEKPVAKKRFYLKITPTK